MRQFLTKRQTSSTFDVCLFLPLFCLICVQLADLDDSYPGGLATYLSKARTLLEDAHAGINPFAEFEAKVPEGEHLAYDDEPDTYITTEEKGLEDAAAGAAFVLVAGGLGERLGYSGIKLSLETELCTEQNYLEFYIRYIQAVQDLVREKKQMPDLKLPLVIMTSGDTDPLTRELLESNDYYGMKDQLTIVTQDKVPALRDGSAGLALEDDDRWAVQTKPHGHGDVHHLLLREGLIDRWEDEGRSHVVFFQDTNALVINSILAAMGVSVERGFQMNSICIPRLAGEAAGAIASLEYVLSFSFKCSHNISTFLMRLYFARPLFFFRHKTDPEKSLVINVEYNQLDPLLQSQGTSDVNDPETGFSPFPGNANNLVMELSSYARTLRGEDQGVVLEFVNPKYKDDTRTEFKKPTRLECMMQDIPKLFQKELGASNTRIGFCLFDRWLTFSPAKNALEAGQEAVRKGSTAPGTMSSAESDLYIANQHKLVAVGVKVRETKDPSKWIEVAGIRVTPGPFIVLGAHFAVTHRVLESRFPNGSAVSISDSSTFVVEGKHITIESMELDGALVLEASPETHVTVRGLKVQNEGWTREELDPQQDYPENIRIRGYTMMRRGTAEYRLTEPGRFVIDESGEVKKVE